MNQNFGYRDTAGISMASLEYPASIIVITECVDMYTTRPVWFDRPTPIYDLAARHNGGLNNAFADGHAKWLGYDEAKRYEYWYFEGGAYSWGG